MHIDARELEHNSEIEGDICIAGAGAAGIGMALDWIGAGFKVILLEGGGFNYDDQVQELYQGKNTGRRYYPLRSSRLHYFGGTTGHWAGFCAPYDPIDFSYRDWVKDSGWPISRATLDPFYARANKLCELGPYEYDLSYWQQQIEEMDPLPLDDRVITSKMWQFSPPTRFGQKYRDAIVTARDIHLYTYANVTRVEANPTASRVQHLVVKNHAGKTHTVKARHYVLACGAIQNARLLLASNKQASNGLGNDRDLVGRYFMEHLEVISGQLLFNRPANLNLYGFDPANLTRPRAEIAFTESAQAQHKILNGTISLTPMALTKNQRPMIDVWTSDDPREAEKELMHNFRDFFDLPEDAKGVNTSRVFELFTRMEQAPNPDSRVILDTETDALGVPRANLHWALSEQDRYSLKKLYEILGTEVGKAGVGRVKMYDFLWQTNNEDMLDSLGGGWHHMGTTRMHDDANQGVVDANCRVHGIDNLYVAGSSCCTTAGAANPTLNLLALSLRLSDHLKEQLNNPVTSG